MTAAVGAEISEETWELFAVAQKYESLGYVTVPVTVWLDDKGKKRLSAPDEWQNLRFDNVADWVGYTGIALNSAASGIATIDVDTGKGKDGWRGLQAAQIDLSTYPTTLEGKTQGGGKHIVYRRGDVLPAKDYTHGELADDVDVKAYGLLFVAPTKTTPERVYKWSSQPPPVADLPEFPAELASRLLAVDKPIVAVVDEPPAGLTAAQRAEGLRILDAKIESLRNTPPGESWNATAQVQRIVGIAKTLGEDLDALEPRVTGVWDGDEERERKITSSYRRAVLTSKPDDPSQWLPEDRERLFWDSRPELRKIRAAAEDGTASPWAVLGALAVRALADVPPTWTLDTGIGTSQGNLNMFAVLAAESGGGKGIATEIAEHLWPVGFDVHITDTASGEALAKLFATSEGALIRNSVVVDVDEYASMKAAADRSGSTLASKLSSGWSGKRLSMTYADAAKNFLVPPGSYRLGVIAGIQYGNAKMLLSAGDEVQGFPQRFVWFPAEIDYDPTTTEPSTELHPPFPRLHAVGHKRIAVPQDVKVMMRAARRGAPGLDGHKLYAQAKLAYALAVLNGHTDAVRTQDWRLATVVMEVSDRTRDKARGAMRARRDAEAEEAGTRDGIRQSAAEDTAHCRSVQRVARNIRKYQDENPGIPRRDLRNKIAQRDRGLFEEALALANS